MVERALLPLGVFFSCSCVFLLKARPIEEIKRKKPDKDKILSFFDEKNVFIPNDIQKKLFFFFQVLIFHAKTRGAT